MRMRILIVLLASLVCSSPSYAKREYLRVVVAEPYIELHTGPGRGYPVFHVADRGAEIEVLKQRTEWYQVRTARGVEGWVNQQQLARTLSADGQPLQVAAAGWNDFTSRRWEVAVGFGDFDGASSISLSGGYRLSENFSAEIVAAQLSGEFSDGWLAAARLLHTPFPEWRLAPYFALGTGVIHISPQSSLVSTSDRTDQFAQAGVGLRAWLAERFIFRAEYNGSIVFTSRDENEGVEEWKAGFAFFF